MATTIGPWVADLTENSRAQTSQESLRARIALVAAVAIVIIGAAWFVGEQQGFDEIGGGGVNASILPAVGEPAPELVTFTPDGRFVRLSDFRGTPLWLNFWGSWCPPCRAEMPEIQAAWETLQSQGVLMLGISQRETPATSVAYARKVGATFPILADPNYLTGIVDEADASTVQDMLRTWQIQNYPTHIFIDADGIVRAVVLQPMSYETAVAYGEMISDGVPGATDATPGASPPASPRPSPVALQSVPHDGWLRRD